MRLQYKAALLIFTIGTLVLLTTLAIYRSSVRSGEVQAISYFLQQSAIESGDDVWHHVESESKEAEALVYAPLVIEAITQGNSELKAMPVEKRQKMIMELNSRWMRTDDESDPFIQTYLNNPVAVYLKKYSERHPGEYGEIFLTNRYGVLVASTGKLTTLAHQHKYWWTASYASGKGMIFIDDRGFDNSTKTVVLGIVVPMKIDGEVAGIIKLNINLSSALHIRQLFDEFHLGNSGVIKIIRSGGDVVLEEGKKPLSTKVSPALLEKLGQRSTGSFVLDEGGKNILIAYSPISFTEGGNNFAFGGNYESIDHSMGNQGEFWYVLISQDLSEALVPLHQRITEIKLMGMFLILVLGIVALLIGRRVALPLTQMALEAGKIGTGDFDVNIKITSNDELGELAKSFNKMAQVTTASMGKLRNEVEERKRAEKRLRKLDNAIEQMAEAVVITDIEGTVEYVNPGFEKITGYTQAEIIGQNPKVLKSGRHDNSFYKNLWETILSGNIWKGKIVNKRKSGELYEEEMTISPILEGQGKITHFVAIKRDVSEQKLLQQQLIHAEKLSSVGTFVAGVAHELNNPLTTILGFSQELAKIKSLPNEIANDLNIIAQESRRTVGIVKNLLRFSRKYKPGKVMFDVNEVVNETVDLQAYRFKTENITIIKKFAQNLPFVHGNVNQIRQVFMNIILNARDAMLSANKGGTLKINTETNGPEVKVIFENDGPPVPPENFNRIFDPFFTTKEVGVGTGLGLSISFGIIKEHDGTLWADNLGDKGVKFTLTLPAVPEPLEQIGSDHGRVEIPENLHILLVEDENKIAEWLTRILVNNGINVQTASNGKAAVDYLVRNNDVDVILSDIKMPELDGFELVNWLNDNSKQYVNRVVLITGVTDQDVDDFCDRYGCKLLIKPFDETQVLEVISAVVKNSVPL